MFQIILELKVHVEAQVKQYVKGFTNIPVCFLYYFFDPTIVFFSLITIMHLSIFCPPGGAAGIHGALDRRPFLTGGNLINLWNPGPG